MEEADQLVRDACRGDRVALGALFDLLYPHLFRYLVARLGDRPTAEDMASEVFVELATRISRFSGNAAAFRAWMYTVARNDLADRARASRRRTVEPMAELPEQATDADLVAAEVSRRLDAELLARLLPSLTADQQDVLALRFGAGHSLAETAAVLGKPVSAVKSLQHRALGALRRLLEQEGTMAP